jgi:hypothetical protein
METVLSQWRTARTNPPSLLVMYAYETVRRSVTSFLWHVNPVYRLPDYALDTAIKELLQLCKAHAQ